MRNFKLSKAEIEKHITYNPITGEFVTKTGTVCKAKNSEGYIYIRVLDSTLPAHRLAFVLMLDRYPLYVDHINSNRTDNRWENLRECTQSDNLGNSNIYKTNTTGVKGVTLDKRSKLWIAQIVKDGVRYRKCFKSLEQATEWIQPLRKELFGEFTNHG